MKILLPLLFLLTSLYAFGQGEKPNPDQIAFDEILAVYYDDEYDSTLSLCHNFLQEHSESTLIPRVKYNIGYILRELGRDEESIPIFEDLLESNYNDRERFGGLMEQYALFKHRSASNLADIYLDLGDFGNAKKYILLFDKKFKYQHFGGNEMMAHEIYTARQYARLYHGQGKTDKAINELLPYVFDNGLASNSAVLKLLDKLLNIRYSADELKKLVVQAQASLTISTKDEAYIEFLNTKIKVLDYQLFEIGNIEFQENLELEGREKWEKVFNTNELFTKYVE